jgi:hypothetical protein
LLVGHKEINMACISCKSEGYVKCLCKMNASVLAPIIDAKTELNIFPEVNVEKKRSSGTWIFLGEGNYL